MVNCSRLAKSIEAWLAELDVVSNTSVIRDGVIIYDGKVGSLQREKDSVKEVKSGYECGLTIDGYNDIKERDTLEAYEIVEIKR
jgi:translation initiation factor IF-2